MTANFPGGGPVTPSFATPSRPATASRAGIWLGGIAVVLAAAALVVGIIALVEVQRQPEPTPQPLTPAVQTEELFVPDADKALCEAIAPMMKESDRRNRLLTDAGSPGSPERSAVIPEYKKRTLDWAARMQKLLNEHADPPRFLTRTLQAYVDGSLLYSENIYPNREPDKFDGAVWDSAAVDYGGPLSTCYKLGVTW